MSAWLKIFDDGTKELGSDKLISEDKASWSRGRLDNISEVKLFNHSHSTSLAVPNTCWHQYDRFQIVMDFDCPRPTKVYQVVQAEIKPRHVGMSIIQTVENNYTSWTVGNSSEGYAIRLNDESVGKWLTLILSFRGPSKLILSTKGKIDDYKYISK